MSKKVLLSWQLGAGQGHIQRLVALAHALELQGCTPIFALKSYNLRGLEFPWESIVVPQLLFSGREDSYTFADILATFGFDDFTTLRHHLQSWQQILQSIQPDLVICDHAPGLVLAARHRIPTVVVGSHFAVPPPVEVFPIFRLPAPPEAEDRQAKVSEVVHQVAELDVSLGQALNGDRSFIFSVPELDSYRAWRVDPQYVGVHIAPLPNAQAQDSGSTWAYLASDYEFRDLVINTLNADATFKPLQEALVHQSLAVHHGGLSTTISCLFAGIPQLILPRYLEQQLTAFSLLQLGVAQIMISPTWEDLLIAQNQCYLLALEAKLWAKKLAQWNHNFIDSIMQVCWSLIT